MHSFFGKSSSPSALIFRAPDAFCFGGWLSNAEQIKVAVAFGHMSGWERVEAAIKSAADRDIQILLGQAFFQTEPKLLLALKELQKSRRAIRARLASTASTFHPKLWLVTKNFRTEAVVGSSNLSEGGFQSNVECNVYVDDETAVQEMSAWFDDQWAIGHDLNGSFFDAYIKEYQSIQDSRRFLRDKIDAAQSRMASVEAKWRKKEALKLAREFWDSPGGQKNVQELEKALGAMHNLLNVPQYSFGPAEYDQFVRMVEFGWIRLTYVKETTAALPQLRTALKKVGHVPIGDAYDQLDKIYGIGPNLATKFLAVFDPAKFVVVNGPVERALLSFGFAHKDLDPFDGTKYEELLKALNPFVEEAEARKLIPAAALDAFFYQYRGGIEGTWPQS